MARDEYRSKARALVAMWDLRQGGTISESEINACRKWLNRIEMNPLRDRDETYDFLASEFLHLRVEDEMAERGIAWLRKLCLKQDGTLRETRLMDTVNDKARLEDVLNDFDHYQLVMFEATPMGSYRQMWFAKYRVIATAGSYFDYLAIPWQSGQPRFDC